MWTVSEAAALAHVTVRTLHHYDEIGLLRPAERSEGGYRLYGGPELERLHQILLWKELGFELDAIGRMLDAPALDRASALRAQRELLADEVRRMEAVARAVDRALESMERGETMDAEAMFQGFGEFDHLEVAQEAEERWGDTPAYGESMRRMKKYSRDDWERIKTESDALEAEMATLLEAGANPSGDEAVDVAERARLHVDRWFYPCSHRMHVGLADMYESDPRFRAHYEERAEGLCDFFVAAIRANAERRE